MKKNYISPETTELKIEESDLLMASNPNVTVDKGDNVDAGEIESRIYDVWDDEFEN